MQNDTKSTGSSSSSNVESSPQSTISKAKDNVYRKFFKTSNGNKLLKQGQPPSTLPERRRADEKENEKENASKTNKALKTASATRSASETRKYASSSNTSTPSFPILSGRQIYPQTQKVEKAHLIKVRTFDIMKHKGRKDLSGTTLWPVSCGCLNEFF